MTTRNHSNNRTGADWRARLLLVLALVPIVGAITIAMASWAQHARQIDDFKAQSAPMELSFQLHEITASLSTAYTTLQAAALPEAGADMRARAAEDRSDALRYLTVAKQRTPDLAVAIATDLGVDVNPFLETMTEAFGAAEVALTAQVPGEPVSDDLTDIVTRIETDFHAGTISSVGWDTDATLRIGVYKTLVTYRSAWAAELRALFLSTSITDGGGDPAAGEDVDTQDVALANLSMAREDAWSFLNPGITTLRRTDGYRLPSDPETGRRLDAAEPIALTFESSGFEMSAAERNRLIDEGLAVDTLLAGDIEHTFSTLIDNVQGEIEERRTAQQLFSLGAALLVGLGVALFLLTRSETRRRHRLELAHVETLARLDTEAGLDPLTGVSNRRHLNNNIDALLSQHDDIGPLVVACVDLDRFKAINDVWGHKTGDEILRIVAQRLGSVTVGGVPFEVVRSGGDEFICYVPVDDPQMTTVTELGTRLITVASEPILADGRRFGIGATAGLSVSDDTSTPHSLLLEADSALILAKRNQRGSASTYNRRISRSSTLIKALPDALTDGQISCLYQPVVEIDSGRISHVEALARWKRPDGLEIGPDEFVPLVESFGMASQLTEVILANVADLQRRLDEPTPGRIWVNVAPVELEVTDFAPRLFRLIEQLGVDPGGLGIEITETAAIGDPEHFARQLHQLNGMGIRTAIDDFGSGYTPLGYLKDLPIDLVKFDRSLLANIETSVSNQHIVRGVIALTAELGIVTVAEGIERLEELRWARENGIRLTQGFLLGRPLPAAEINWALVSDLLVPD